MTWRYVTPLLFVALIAAGAARSAFAVAPARPTGTLVFASNRGGHYSIYTAQADGTLLGRLTDTAEDDTSPLFSPDGRRILFERDACDKFPRFCSGLPALWVMNADGTDQRRLAAVGTRAAWAPNSRDVVFTVVGSGAPTLAALDVDSGAQLLALPGADLGTWSPDGSHIAFVQQRDAAVDLDVVGRDGAGLRTIEPGIAATPPAWSPAGDLIAYSEQDGLHVVGPAGDGDRLVGPGGGAVSWAPDGSSLAYITATGGPYGGGALSVVSAAGGAARSIPGFFRRPVWSPDGVWLAVEQPFGGDWTTSVGSTLLAVSADGSSSQVIEPGNTYPFGGDSEFADWRPGGAAQARLGSEPVLVPWATAARGELQTPGPIRGLDADGARVAIAADGTGACVPIAVWRPGTAPVQIGVQQPCNNELADDEQAYHSYGGPIALAGTRVLWGETTVGRDTAEHGLMTTATSDPTDIGVVAGTDVLDGAQHDDVGFPRGGGGLLVYNRWTVCAADSCDSGEPWNGALLSNRQLWGIEDGKQVLLRSGRSSFQVAAVQNGRIVTMEPGGAIDVIRADGSLIHRLVLPKGLALTAALDGGRLVVLTKTALRSYRAGDGKLLRTRRLLRSSKRVLAGVDRGVAAYVDGRTVHLLALASGRQASLVLPGKGPVFARLASSGLFTGYSLASGTSRGRVDFTARAGLDRRLGGRG